ncbi:hypothetical protein RRG08_041873 [Elysia crispata]|uniref:Uncharacterized protein n=1 Tax=Elysia crispata TaxID=231223 RepID=A0AAE0Y0K1_9GAST|nr:hypothetical protein RRG08_041873 [Elysia crispata]
MEVNSMHSALEHEKKHTDMFCVTDWLGVFEKSERNVKYPCETFMLCHGDFLDSQSTAITLIKNPRKIDYGGNNDGGNNVEWLEAKSIRNVRHAPNAIYYKYDFDDNYRKIAVSVPSRRTIPNFEPKPAHKDQLPLANTKNS